MDNQQNDSLIMQRIKFAWGVLCNFTKLLWDFICDVAYFYKSVNERVNDEEVSASKKMSIKNFLKDFRQHRKNFHQSYRLIRKNRIGETTLKTPLKGGIRPIAGIDNRKAIEDKIISLTTIFALMVGFFFAIWVDFTFGLFDINLSLHWLLWPCVLAFFILYYPVVWYQLRNYKIGEQGELAVAQELNKLTINSSCRVFHSVIIEVENIDHIIVCPKGIFCLETKTRRRFPDETNKIEFKNGVIWAGKKNLGDGAVKQAKRNALQLSNFLKENMEKEKGEFIKPIIVFPEWSVSDEAGDDNQKKVYVRNHKQIIPLLKSLPTTLENDFLDKVCSVLDEKFNVDTEELF